ncbi:hypothetical protein A8F94_22635 [Bacillus sp. FJAT-27225]|uniref:hypothetical protein n=1 Tax=Bacillus sp. FJAT-27225 TaxID=1743144 RepID=UPI00080C222F|nr:hypothetical protein [Bacillus sp. FJAT-27225]OCA81660.1 hypothetical protein A8F94_22635 [Bacillus sp. FJAT-27225]
MKKQLILGFVLLISLSIAFLAGCSNRNDVSLVQINEISASDREWMESLEKGLYFKKENDNEGLLYVNLKDKTIRYTTVVAEVIKDNNGSYKININEKDVFQDSEVTNDYFGNLRSNIPLDTIKFYRNDKKIDLVIME